jgi:hypothetical protein
VPDGDLAVVTESIDTDTIDVAIGGVTYRVRYIGMDTPERGDYFFTEATEANRALVEGQQVILVKDISETDRFGRLLICRSRRNRPTVIRLARPFVFPLPHRIKIVVKYHIGTLLFYRPTRIVLMVIAMGLAVRPDVDIE